MISILSTKLLTPPQKSLLVHSGLAFVEYPAITVEYLDFQIPTEVYDYFVFTSQQGVQAYLKQYHEVTNSTKAHNTAQKIKALCVGSKTRSVLEQNGIEVVAMGENAQALGQIITTNYGDRSFLLFSVNLRRDELPNILKKSAITYKEIIAYHTHPNPKKFTSRFNGILFFSPSGVESFLSENSIMDAMTFAIGPTTAAILEKYTDKIIIAQKPTVENVIVKAVNYFASYD